jgi:hypothetical protein
MALYMVQERLNTERHYMDVGGEHFYEADSIEHAKKVHTEKFPLDEDITVRVRLVDRFIQENAIKDLERTLKLLKSAKITEK